MAKTKRQAPPQTFKEAFQEVSELARTFEAGIDTYKRASYSESQARKDFIDKFFWALGWDVDHDVQRNPLQQEVKVERSAGDATTQRRADYSFAIAPHFDSILLYAEAKKPHVELTKSEHCFQAVRYGYQRGHPVGILTDFEELCLVDCRFVPDLDNAARRLLKRYQYTKYTDPKVFREIYGLFSRQAVAAGSLETYSKTLPKLKGRLGQRTLFREAFRPVDEKLLSELEQHRATLARSLKNRNPNLSSEHLTELTQRILDRLVFIRFLEDKQIEALPIVQYLGDASGNTWHDFIDQSRRLNKRYIYTTRTTRMNRHPNALAFLKQFRSANKCKEVKAKKHPFWALHRPRDPRIFVAPKLIGLTTTKTIELALDEKSGVYVTDAMYVFRPKDGFDIRVMLAVMQSRTFLFLFRTANQGESRVIPQIKASKLAPLPFPTPCEKQAGRLRELVARMFAVRKARQVEQVESRQTSLDSQFDAVDREIDSIVAEMYGISVAERESIHRSFERTAEMLASGGDDDSEGVQSNEEDG